MPALLPRSVMLLIVTLAACTPSDESDRQTIESLPRLSVAEELRIGSVDDPAAGFTSISHLDLDADGNLYLVENSVPEVRVYDEQGTLLRRFGQRGAGPGEFESVNGFGVQDDTVWLFDFRHRRLTLFDRGGALLSTAPLEEALVPLPTGSGYVFPHRMREDGTLTGRLAAVMFGGDNPNLVSGPSDLIPVPVVRFTARGQVVDTIGWVERPVPGLWRPAAEERSLPQAVTIGGRSHPIPEPAPDWVELRQLPDSYIIVERSTPQTVADGFLTVTRISFAGDTLYRRELGYTPVRYSASDLDSIAARATRGEGLSFSVVGGSAPQVENPQAVTNRIRSAMQYPEFQQPIDHAIGMDDGSLWIAHRLALSDSITWIILGPDGTPRGRLDLPGAVTILRHSGDTIHASVRDELDVPWLVKYWLQGG